MYSNKYQDYQVNQLSMCSQHLQLHSLIKIHPTPHLTGCVRCNNGTCEDSTASARQISHMQTRWHNLSRLTHSGVNGLSFGELKVTCNHGNDPVTLSHAHLHITGMTSLVEYARNVTRMVLYRTVHVVTLT